MIINYHHHSTLTYRQGRPYILSIHGRFLSEIALKVQRLNLFLYENPDRKSCQEDFEINIENIRVFSLGVKKNIFHRSIFTSQMVEKINSVECDILLFRSPTPLLVAHNIKARIVPIIVGDYKEDIKSVSGSLLKRILIIIWIFWYSKRQASVLKKLNLVLFNNIFLQNKYQAIVRNSKLVSTSLVSENDLSNSAYEPNLSYEISILYAGRIDNSKGIRELIEALPIIINHGLHVKIKIVGWDITENEVILGSLKSLVEKLGVTESVIFYGKVNHGRDLYRLYEQCDIFYLGSKASEGFPRALWEAMATKTPILCTKAGGISHFVSEKEVFFLEEVSSQEIAERIIHIVHDENARNSRVIAAFELVKSFTIEKNITKLIKLLQNEVM